MIPMGPNGGPYIGKTEGDPKVVYATVNKYETVNKYLNVRNIADVKNKFLDSSGYAPDKFLRLDDRPTQAGKKVPASSPPMVVDEARIANTRVVSPAVVTSMFTASPAVNSPDISVPNSASADGIVVDSVDVSVVDGGDKPAVDGSIMGNVLEAIMGGGLFNGKGSDDASVEISEVASTNVGTSGQGPGAAEVNVVGAAEVDGSDQQIVAAQSPSHGHASYGDYMTDLKYKTAADAHEKDSSVYSVKY